MHAARTHRPDPQPDQRTELEILVDGRWFRGELRDWQQRGDGSWWANVEWMSHSGETYIDMFPADRVRPDETGTALLVPAPREVPLSER